MSRSNEMDSTRAAIGKEDSPGLLARGETGAARLPGSRAAAWGPWWVLLGGAAWAIWSWYADGLVYELLRTDLDAADQIERLRQAFERLGLWAPAAYVVMVTIESVVAPIPGLLLYAPGGMIFGPVPGGALSLAGNVIGAGLASTVARRAAARWRERFLNKPSHLRLRGELERRGAWWVFWLRLNPLTSSDLVSYAAGLAGVRPGKVMGATAVGMAPLCFVQSALAHELFRAVPGLIYPFIGLCLVYLAAAVWVVKRALTGAGEKIAGQWVCESIDASGTLEMDET